MILCGLVLLSSSHLELDLFDPLDNPHPLLTLLLLLLLLFLPGFPNISFLMLCSRLMVCSVRTEPEKKFPKPPAANKTKPKTSTAHYDDHHNILPIIIIL
jgi:type III secretory pathway component EscV